MTKLQFALVVAAGAVVSSMASAADLGGYKDTPYVSIPNWSGLYFGGHAGGVWGNANINDTFVYVGDPDYAAKLASTSFIGGAQIGYNIQRGNFVFGPEADIGYLGISVKNSAKQVGPDKCTGTYTAPPYSWDYSGTLCKMDLNYSVSSDLYGDLTARLGYASGRTLFYAKGGAAFLNASLKNSYTGANIVNTHTFDFAKNETLWGWTIGAGVEYALSPAWSLKAEYQHFDFGSISKTYSGSYQLPGYTAADYTGGHYTSTVTNGKADVSVTADSVSVGLNYHVGGDGLK
jgi:outer membrane immunogenic protein